MLRTGWLNVLGQFATTAGAGAQLSNHVANMWLLANGHVFTPVEVLLTYASAHLHPPPWHDQRASAPCIGNLACVAAVQALSGMRSWPRTV